MSAAAQASAIPAGTPDWVVAHARRQQRHFRWAEWAHRWLPRRWHPRAAMLVANQFSPELAEAAKIWRGLQQFTGCSDAEAHALLSLWYANQGQFAMALHDYPRLDRAWAHEQVDCDDRALLAELAANGGLVLTYHSQHHNRSGAFFGLSGRSGSAGRPDPHGGRAGLGPAQGALSGTCVWGIAATEENSPWKPWTARWVRLINGGSESHFGGGTYLFTDELRTLLKKSREGLQRGETVVTLADNDSGSDIGSARVNIAGRGLRVATGMIELAQEVGATITFALFYGDLQGGYRCRLARMPDAGRGVAPAQVAQAYVDQLMQWCRADPWAWQGWMWWEDLPSFDEPRRDLGALHAGLNASFEASRPQPGASSRLLARLGELQMRLSPPRP